MSFCARKPHALLVGTLCLLALAAQAGANEELAASAAEKQPPHIEELQSFEAPPIEAIEGETYRLVWHAWHKKPGLLTISCAEQACFAELRRTDGYGTYTQGKFAGRASSKIDRKTFDTLAGAFEDAGLWTLPGHLPIEGDAFNREGLPGGLHNICLHAPHYWIEARAKERSMLIYRYCQDTYPDGLNAVAPMITLFWTLFPKDMAMVSGLNRPGSEGAEAPAVDDDH